jgi:cytochrome c oxidase subunit 2
MVVLVVAQPRAAFDRWLAHNAQPAANTDAAGRRIFLANACAGCHQIRGTTADGHVGPDLTHFASRMTIAAVRIPNDPAHLAAWLRHPQAIKPGNKMPDLALAPSTFDALGRYMESLR